MPRGPVNLLGRYPNDLLLGHIDVLRAVVRAARARHPFQVDAWIVFADHLHWVWTLPAVDDDFADRWRLIKLAFSRPLPLGERCCSARIAWSLRG